ncbi:MAG TPA: carbon-nitrogen hydrolase family protein [Propionibacteriaceae bacterium]|nr:carbon-nitrogen hydrolase family protein [Propionibacteriaceae bacterium]
MRVALAQISSGHDVAANLATITSVARRAATEGAELVVFPEAAMYGFGAPLAPIAEPLDGPFATSVQVLARDLGLTVVVGMFTPAPDNRVLNTLLVVSPESVDHYDKVHLFDAFGVRESETVAPGDSLRTVDVGGTTVGLATCYDVRFPGLFVENAAAGALVSVVCASWASGPGKVEQWELLVRARALDSTTYVLACGQALPLGGGTATAPTGVGHSMVVDPFGQVVARLGDDEGLLVTDLDLAVVQSARETLPVLRNRRDLRHA